MYFQNITKISGFQNTKYIYLYMHILYTQNCIYLTFDF